VNTTPSETTVILLPYQVALRLQEAAAVGDVLPHSAGCAAHISTFLLDTGVFATCSTHGGPEVALGTGLVILFPG